MSALLRRTTLWALTPSTRPADGRPHREKGCRNVLSRNVGDLQLELPRLAQAERIGLRRVEPLDDSLESVFGYLVDA